MNFLSSMDVERVVLPLEEEDDAGNKVSEWKLWKC